MNKIARYLFVLIIATVGGSIILLLSLYFNQKKIIETQNAYFYEIGRDNKLKDRRISMLRTQMKSMFSNNGNKIDPEIILFDEKNDSINILNLVKINSKLVFRYTEINCSACVDSQILFLKKMSHEIGSNRILFFAYYENPRNLGMFKRINQLDIKVYKIKNLGIDLEKQNSPYYFILNNDCEISYTFIPDKDDSELTKSYLEAVNLKLEVY